MSLTDIINYFSSITIWSVLKLLILLSLVIYFFFAIVVIRQVKVMTATFKTGLELPLKIIAVFLLLFVLGIFISALVFL